MEYRENSSDGKLTLHGLFSSKPGGAVTLSVCPRKYPVNLLSRSITATISVNDVSQVHQLVYAHSVGPIGLSNV